MAFIDGESHTCEPKQAPPIFGCLVAVVLGFLLQFPLVIVGERLHSTAFSGWTFWHVTFGVVWPVLSLLVFVCLKRFRKGVK